MRLVLMRPMHRSNLMNDYPYDFEAVTARLEAMKARRGKWQSRKNEGPRKQQLSERETTCGFELAPADLSSGGSDVDSDDDYQSSSTSSLPSDDDKTTDSCLQSQKTQNRAKARKIRVTDSLDLSISVSTASRSPRQAETRHSGRINPPATYSKLSLKDPIRRLSQQNYNNQASSSALPECNAMCKPSRIPKLVRQRRQLQGQRAAKAGGYLQAPTSEVSSVAPTNQRQPSSLAQSSKHEMLPHTTRSPTRDISNNGWASVNKGKTSNSGGSPEEISSTSAEEQRLLQSLEKLDRRLSNVSNSAVSVREGGQQVRHNEQTLKSDSFRTRQTPENRSTVGTTNEKTDDNTLRAAAYGGGTHCKIRQPSSVSVRSSSAKRAEFSSGFHKSRVRVGGAFVNDSRRNSHTDGSGKHKIVVKKDLAHLLF